MFLLRLNQNINIIKTVEQLVLQNNKPLQLLKFVELYCIKRNLNTSIFFKILFTIFRNEWQRAQSTRAANDLFYVLKITLNYYKQLKKSSLINYLNFDYEVSYNSLFSYMPITFKSFKTPTSGFKDIFNWAFNLPISLHLIRTQRRYNKRRYARVRAVSRPSFWFGSLLGSIGLGLFWGATMQLTDWITVQLVIVDINALLLFLYIYLIWRWCNLIGRGSYYAVRGTTYLGDGYQLLIQHKLNNARWW